MKKERKKERRKKKERKNKIDGWRKKERKR